MEADVGCRRVRVPDSIPQHDYASCFELRVPTGPALSASGWARAVFEGAPAVVRGVLVAGWRYGLGLRLSSASGVLGWELDEHSPDTASLAAASPWLTAFNDVRVEPGRVLWITRVTYRSRLGRVLWSTAAPVHHWTLPRLVEHAATREHRRPAQH